MATRKIKDAKDLSTQELIYFKGHAKATFMSDGKTVEDAINQIGAGGGVTAETDPIFSASPAASITEDKISSWDAKLEGKSVMSTEASPSFPQVLFVPQELTEEQKAIARANIGVDSFVADMVNTAINSSY